MKWYEAIRDFDSAKAYLDMRRGKWSLWARLESGVAVERESRDAVEIHLTRYNATVITFHIDGSRTLRLVPVDYGYGRGSYVPQGPINTINKHGDTRVFRRGGKLYVGDLTRKTDRREQKCRQCRGTGLEFRHCSGQAYASWGPCSHAKKTPEEQVIEAIRIPGEHRFQTDIVCFGCHGEGRRDYGGRAAAVEWSGEVRLDKEGRVMQDAA